MAEQITARQIQLGSGEVLDVPDCCFAELAASLATKALCSRRQRCFSGDLIVTNFKKLPFQMFCHWCQFLIRFQQFSTQVQKFQLNFLPENCGPEFLLQLLQIADLFCVRSLQDFVAKQLAQRMEGMSVEEIKQLFTVARECKDAEYHKFLQDIYVDELNHDFVREDSDM